MSPSFLRLGLSLSLIVAILFVSEASIFSAYASRSVGPYFYPPKMGTEVGREKRPLVLPDPCALPQESEEPAPGQEYWHNPKHRKKPIRPPRRVEYEVKSEVKCETEAAGDEIPGLLEKIEEYRAKKKAEKWRVKREDFSDVPRDHGDYLILHELKKRGIISGIRGKNHFKPFAPIDRATALKMLLEARGDFFVNGKLEATEKVFPDVEKGEWFEPYFVIAKGFGLIEGFEDGTAKPQLLLHRTDALVLAYKVFEIPVEESKSSPFSDVSASDWFLPYYIDAVERGVIEEKQSKVEPFEPINRAEFARMLWKLINAR